MIHRFIEAEDDQKSNHGKFSIMRFGSDDIRARSEITRGPLLSSIPRSRHLGRQGITGSTLLLLDLQTEEGMLFDPKDGPEEVRRRFLMHPLKVCVLYFPLMRFLSQHADEIWKLPKLVTLPIADVVDQPGVLLDSNCEQVRCMTDWSRRPPLAVRFRNRDVPIEEDGQGVVEDMIVNATGLHLPNS